MRHPAHPYRLVAAGAALSAAALVIPTIPAHAAARPAAKTAAPAASAVTPSSLLSVCLIIHELNIHDCLVI